MFNTLLASLKQFILANDWWLKYCSPILYMLLGVFFINRLINRYIPKPRIKNVKIYTSMFLNLSKQVSNFKLMVEFLVFGDLSDNILTLKNCAIEYETSDKKLHKQEYGLEMYRFGKNMVLAGEEKGIDPKFEFFEQLYSIQVRANELRAIKSYLPILEEVTIDKFPIKIRAVLIYVDINNRKIIVPSPWYLSDPGNAK